MNQLKQTYAMADINQAAEQIQLALTKVSEKQGVRLAMLAEDFLESFAQQDPIGTITVRIDKFLGETYVKLIHQGAGFNPLEDYSDDLEDLSIEEDPDPLRRIRQMLFRAYGEGIRYARKGQRNILTLKIQAPATKSLYLNLGALVLAVILGQLLSVTLPEAVGLGLSTYLLTPIKTIFMNLLNLVMVPVVFFSIITCVGGFTNLSDLGRIGGKSFGLYMFTSVAAIAAAIAAYFLVPPSIQGIQAVESGSVSVATVELSAVDTIVGIFPSNIISPFADANMLQLIFLGLILGVCLTMLGEKGKPLNNLLDICNDLFMTFMGIIVRFLPLVTLATVTAIVIEMGLDVMISLVGLLGCYCVGIVLIMVVYTLIFMVLSHKSPLPLFRKVVPLLITAFSLSSSNATIPTTVDTCQNKLGVHPKVCSFTIPLGATINMDGTCIYTMVASLFLANVYGLEVSGPMLISLAGVVLALSIGMPGMPGSGLIAISMAITQLGLPVEAVGVVIGIDRLSGMLRTLSNVLGDTVVTVAVATSEKLLDEEVYYK